MKKEMKEKKDFEFRLMLRQDNIEVLAGARPKALKRMINIIKDAYMADFKSEDEINRWFYDIEQREMDRIPTRSNLEVMSNMNHIKMLIKSHYKFRFDAFKMYGLKNK